MINIEIVLEHYLIAALWSCTDDNDAPFDSNWSTYDFFQDTLSKSTSDIQKFIDLAGHMLEGITDEMIGHDFWLTRCGHGVGFWDRELEYGEELTTICQTFGSVYVYETNDKITIE